MALEQFSAVVLQAYETGETSEVVRTFSAEHGRLSVMCKGLRRAGSRLAGIIQPLATIDMTVYLREGAEMGALRDASPVTDRAGIRGDLERLALGSLLAETAAESCDAAQPSPDAFAILERGLDALQPDALQPAPTAAAHHLLRLLALAGYEPHIDPSLLQSWEGREKPRTFWLDAVQGLVHAVGTQPLREPVWPQLSAPGAHVVPLPPEAVRAIWVNQRASDGDLAALPAIESSRAMQLIDGLVLLAEHHLERPLRSARFWRSIVR